MISNDSINQAVNIVVQTAHPKVTQTETYFLIGGNLNYEKCTKNTASHLPFFK
jgi:hypothetical protein